LFYCPNFYIKSGIYPDNNLPSTSEFNLRLNYMIRKLLINFILLFLLSLIWFNCKNNKSDFNNSNVSGTFKFILSDPVESLDPANILYSSDGLVASLCYEGIVALTQKQNELEPLIAESWEKTDNGKIYIFKIRKGIKFHNDPCFPGGKGRELISDDIIYTFERIADPKSENAAYSLFRDKIEGIDDFHTGKAKSISGIIAADDHTIEFRLTKPYVTFLMCLSTPLAYILPKEAVDHYKNNFGKHPVGTGPFRLAVWKPLQEMVFVKNENYRQTGKDNKSIPILDEINIRLIPNTSMLTSEFLKGENYLYLVDNVTLRQLLRETDFAGKYKIIEVSCGLSVRFLGFAVDKKNSPVENINIRKAIALNFNREKIFIDTPENFIPANSLIGKELLDNAELRWLPYNPDEAKKIMQNIPADLIKRKLQISSTINSRDIKLFEQITGEMGFKSLVEIEPNQYYENIINKRPDVFRVSMFPSFPDPEEYYALFYSKSGPALNLTGYKNDEFDKIFEESMFEQNIKNRIKLFLQLEEILKRDLPAIFISHEGPRYYVLPKFVEGLKIRHSMPDFRQVWLRSENEIEN
jgi:oligopeptide transport system substrate-binding protein